MNHFLPMLAVVLALVWCGLGRAAPVDLLLVSDAQPWLVAASCPVLGRLRTGDRWPLLLAVGRSPGAEVHAFLAALAPQDTLMLASPGTEDPLAGLVKRVEKLPEKPLSASLALAESYWGKSAGVVAAPLEDPEAVILASALAAHQGQPVLVYESGDYPGRLLECVARLGATRLTLAKQAGPLAENDRPGRLKIESLTGRQIEDRIAAELPPGEVRTIIVARAPEGGAGRTAWLAPYLSLVRRAPIAMVHAAKAPGVETVVNGLVARRGLRPRSITLLGDNDSIGTHVVQIEPVSEGENGPRRLAIEPCLPKGLETTAAVGVGRIPLVALKDASLLLARGLARPRLLASRRPEMLMLANAAMDQSQLPLCEVISQLTAAELKNFGVACREFYRVSTDHPEVRTAAESAQLILFQGHTEHQLLVASGRRTDAARNGAAAANANRPWNGVPVVIFQTCESLRPEAFWQIHELGGVALVGTGSPVHSASGSSLIKSAIDSALYRGSTLGEALRDAKNYFACLMDLKNLRGHTEQAKVCRTALSFRLWGDPELELFGPRPVGPVLPPVSAQWSGRDQLQVRVVPAALPEARNEQFTARIRPGSEVAGLVVKQARSGLRRVLPLYFFRLPLPEGFPPGDGAWAGPGEDGDRGLFRVDPAGQFLYVLYLPDHDTARKSFTLQRVKRPPLERPPGG